MNPSCHLKIDAMKLKTTTSWTRRWPPAQWASYF